MFDSPWPGLTPEPPVNNFLEAFSLVAPGVVELAGCFRFLDEFDDELTSSGFARNDEVPGISSLAAVELSPFVAVRLFRMFDFSPSTLVELVGTPAVRLEDLEPG